MADNYAKDKSASNVIVRIIMTRGTVKFLLIQ